MGILFGALSETAEAMSLRSMAIAAACGSVVAALGYLNSKPAPRVSVPAPIPEAAVEKPVAPSEPILKSSPDLTPGWWDNIGLVRVDCKPTPLPKKTPHSPRLPIPK